MKTKVSVLVMVLAGIVGFFLGAFLDNNAMDGAILCSMIAGIACVVYTIDHQKD